VTWIAATQLGFRRVGPKPVTLVDAPAHLPEDVPYVVNEVPYRHLPARGTPAGWGGERYPWPFDIGQGPFDEGRGNYGDIGLTNPDGQPHGLAVARGALRRRETRWGTVWQAEIDLDQLGIFQVETDVGRSFPFLIGDRPYDRLLWGLPHYLSSQRSGMEIPGIRSAMHLDDGILDTDGSQIPAAGGWYDAGDGRKWMGQTLPCAESLADIVAFGPPGVRERALDEIAWGNRFFHAMISDAGQVYEDIGGGAIPDALASEDPWFENHALVAADGSGSRSTDNVPGTGDERIVRTRYNPWVQFLFVRVQTVVAGVVDERLAGHCRSLAERAWRYGRARSHERRTLFLAGELGAGAALASAGAPVSWDELGELAESLVGRQARLDMNGSGFFLEMDHLTPFRAITVSAEPAMALVRLLELGPPARLSAIATEAVRRYVEDYLLADALSNPFRVTPYGVWSDPPRPDLQAYRSFGADRWIRTFLPPWNDQQIAHGTSSVVTHHAHLLARAARVLDEPTWADAADRLLQWSLGHNPYAMSLFTGIGFRHPVAFSTLAHQIPEAAVTGFIGREDDSPYLEESASVEWNTQEVWGLPYAHAAAAATRLR
jgi:hypothetical protein